MFQRFERAARPKRRGRDRDGPRPEGLLASQADGQAV